MHYHGTPDGWLVVGFGFGLVLVFRGLRLYRKMLLVEDTKIIPARSVAMGAVQIHGIAKGDGAFPSPVSGAPCYAYKVQIERRNPNARGWSHYRTDQNGGNFYLEDASGYVLVDPRGAEFDLPKFCRRQVPPSSMFDDELDPTPEDVNAGSDVPPEPRTDDDLLRFAGEPGYMGPDSFRFTEYCILPGWPYDILGTCVENPRPKDENDRNLIVKGQTERTFLISSKPEQQLERSMSWKSTLMVWGGTALTIACAAILLAEHGLL